MRRLVVDASVTVKWLLSHPHDEEHTGKALSLLEAFQNGEVELLQPPHWLAETGAVLARLEPEVAVPAIRLLDALDVPLCHGTGMYERGIELSVRLNHHLFDTLYHAVALCGDAEVLVTADMQYFRKARHIGAVCPLADFSHIGD